ncbi:Ferric iron ABC transporter, ATP-binding protein [Klebsiella pneumoniae]|uniref:Ferric iron ABC transporter, ATP-binding protein n=2 Tax=Klebsiella pneumoniae complex TaxID=3390273 RepID=A0A7H4MH10_KLEVA|nr:Ferric iron ABC transporter, ATP-binding protein [Klebsiella variicola]STW40020.1 Ferric iron ABC transporter, ATP-binding protein [Klebsiella pneumoniae]
MLRPEQLSVSVSGPQESTAIIRDVDFSGQLSTLTLSMAGHERPIVLRNREPAGVAARRDGETDGQRQGASV